MKKAIEKIGVNKEYIKNVPREKFIEDHKDGFPDNDLGALWDEHNPKTDEAKKVVKTPKPGEDAAKQ